MLFAVRFVVRKIERFAEILTVNGCQDFSAMRMAEADKRFFVPLIDRNHIALRFKVFVVLEASSRISAAFFSVIRVRVELRRYQTVAQ